MVQAYQTLNSSQLHTTEILIYDSLSQVISRRSGVVHTNMDTTTDEAQPSTSQATDIAKIKTLLKAKDDTQRFVGLALLKSVLDGSEELRQDEKTVHSLWSSLSPKFLDRLLRTGSKPSNKNAKEMLDLVVSVLHIFSILLPDQAKSDSRFIDRSPLLVAAILYRYCFTYKTSGR